MSHTRKRRLETIERIKRDMDNAHKMLSNKSDVQDLLDEYDHVVALYESALDELGSISEFGGY